MSKHNDNECIILEYKIPYTNLIVKNFYLKINMYDQISYLD